MSNNDTFPEIDTRLLNLHHTRTALQTIGQYVVQTHQPGSEPYQAMEALWADMEAREARGDFRTERAAYDSQGERQQMQEAAIIRLLRNVTSDGNGPAGMPTMPKRELTQRCYNLACFRHDPAGRNEAIKATLARMEKSGKISVVNTLVTIVADV